MSKWRPRGFYFLKKHSRPEAAAVPTHIKSVVVQPITVDSSALQNQCVKPCFTTFLPLEKTGFNSRVHLFVQVNLPKVLYIVGFCMPSVGVSQERVWGTSQADGSGRRQVGGNLAWIGGYRGSRGGVAHQEILSDSPLHRTLAPLKCLSRVQGSSGDIKLTGRQEEGLTTGHTGALKGR